jgi:hypothetical protein
MNDDEYSRWCGYFRTLADQIGLKDWRIDLLREVPDSEWAGAAMMTLTGRKVVQIKLSKRWPEFEPEEQRHYALHELVHVFTDDIDTAIWQAKDVIGGDAFTLLEKIVKDRIEFATDALAGAIGHAFPLPNNAD